jgi:hypothetical protein
MPTDPLGYVKGSSSVDWTIWATTVATVRSHPGTFRANQVGFDLEEEYAGNDHRILRSVVIAGGWPPSGVLTRLQPTGYAVDRAKRVPPHYFILNHTFATSDHALQAEPLKARTAQRQSLWISLLKVSKLKVGSRRR